MGKTTTKPEGATSFKETAFGIISRSRLLRLELEGTKKGLEYLYGLVKERKDVIITPQLMCKLHGVSFGWIFPRWAGKYRTIQVTYSGKEAPPYYQISELVTNCCKDLEERIKQLPDPDKEGFIVEVGKLLAWFQHRFVVIHPFQDYNGRIARMLTVLILITLSLPPIEIKAESKIDRKRYITAMKDADADNFSTLEGLIGHALSETLEQFRRKHV